MARRVIWALSPHDIAQTTRACAGFHVGSFAVDSGVPRRGYLGAHLIGMLSGQIGRTHLPVTGFAVTRADGEWLSR